jgi:hypothetical protein
LDLDLARPLGAAAIQVVIGGFHVSGCHAKVPKKLPALQAALDLGCSLFAGEAEDGRLDTRPAGRGPLNAETDLQLTRN